MKKIRNPKLMMQLGNLCLIAGSLSAYKLHWDGLTGLMYGAAIGFLGLSAHLSARRRAGRDTTCA